MSERRKPLRFILVGVLNTAIDFLALFGLTAVGVPIVPANMLSTGLALTFSFFANRSFTFRAAGGAGGATGQAVRFLAVTLFGLWALQPVVLLLGTWLLAGVLGEGPALFVSKVLATGVSMVWNYLLYDRFVFRTRAADAAPEHPEHPEQQEQREEREQS